MSAEQRRRGWPHEPRRHAPEPEQVDLYRSPILAVAGQILLALDAAPRHRIRLRTVRKMNRRSTVDEALGLLLGTGQIDLRFRLLCASRVDLRERGTSLRTDPRNGVSGLRAT